MSKREETRERIMTAVRELLAEGAFHTSTVEEVAKRAGISRATVYQHFGSRLAIVDAVCATFDENPALLALRDSVTLPDADAALAKTTALAARFWATEDAVLSQIYGVVAVDPAARDLVVRQRADRRGEMIRLVENLAGLGRLRAGLSKSDALATLLVLTSYETFLELRLAGLSDRRLTARLQQSARSLLLD